MSKQPKNINKSGFTIIEVVLVLAIAGLIFLMVFVAFPALQRNQRDTQRRDDYAMLESQVISASSANGLFPTGDNYQIGKENASTDNGEDPKGLGYSILFKDSASGLSLDPITGTGVVRVYIVHSSTGSKCSADGTPEDGGGAKSFAIYAQLENGTYCRTASI